MDVAVCYGYGYCYCYCYAVGCGGAGAGVDADAIVVGAVAVDVGIQYLGSVRGWEIHRGVTPSGGSRWTFPAGRRRGTLSPFRSWKAAG